MTIVGQLLALKSGPPMRRLRWAGPLLLPHEQDELSFVAVWQAIWGGGSARCCALACTCARRTCCSTPAYLAADLLRSFL